MTSEQKRDFTRRVANANRSGLMLIKFEILFVYMEDACAAFAADDSEGFKAAVRSADNVLKSFEETLDFTYEMSGRLYALYDFHRRQLAKALMRHSTEEIEESRRLLKQMYETFSEVAKQDQSAPLMRHAQQVYAGMTYGKGDLNENIDITEPSRGFLA